MLHAFIIIMTEYFRNPLRNREASTEVSKYVPEYVKKKINPREGFGGNAKSSEVEDVNNTAEATAEGIDNEDDVVNFTLSNYIDNNVMVTEAALGLDTKSVADKYIEAFKKLDKNTTKNSEPPQEPTKATSDIKKYILFIDDMVFESFASLDEAKIVINNLVTGSYKEQVDLSRLKIFQKLEINYGIIIE